MWWINLLFLHLPEEINFIILDYYDVWKIENEECQNKNLEDWYRDDGCSKTKLVSAKMAVFLIQVACMFTTLSLKEFGCLICHISTNPFCRKKQIFIHWNQHQSENGVKDYPFKALRNSLSFATWIFYKKKRISITHCKHGNPGSEKIITEETWTSQWKLKVKTHKKNFKTYSKLMAQF